MSYRRLFPSKYLRADVMGRHRVLVIVSVVQEEEVGDHVQKLVAYFDPDQIQFLDPLPSSGEERTLRTEIKKGLPLNVTNCQSIEELTKTDDETEWAGTALVLYGTTADLHGKRVAAIRIEAPPKKSAKPKKAAPPSVDVDVDDDVDDDDDPPF